MLDALGKKLIVGTGNPDRGDDAAGLLVARALRERGLPAKECSGEATVLMSAWEGFDEIWLIDAMQSGRVPGSILRMEAHQEEVPMAELQTSSHAFGVAQAIELSRVLGVLPHKMHLYAIEGHNFELGQPMTPAVEQAVLQTIREIERACMNFL